METHVNTYQGLNKDAAYDSIPSSLYIDALDIRITTTTGESMGGFTNMQGNEFAVAIPIVGDSFGGWTAKQPEIIGYTTIRNRIVLLVADNSDTKGWIYDLFYDSSSRIIGSINLKYYNANFGFSKTYPIEALGRYESPSIQRVYWTDYYNFFRSINLESPSLATTPLSLIDIYPDVTYTQPLLQIVSSGGNILTGEYQFAYRLITNDGKESLISPPSNLIHIVSDSELTGSADYNGNPTAINSGKSITISVDTSGYASFNKIEFVSIYHSSATSIPEVKVVEQIAINNQPTVSLVYTSNEGQSYPIELLAFTQKNYAFKTCKTLTQKDSSLVVANIISSKISIQDLLDDGETFSAKTRRYRNIGGTITPPYTPGAGNDPNDLLNAFNQPLNKDAHWDSDWQTNEQYKYQSDGVRLGGEGLNISYNFHLEPFTVDGDVQAGFANLSPVPFGFPRDSHDLNDGYGTRANTTYANNASPYISGLLRGYKRGETYRFGIVFYTNKGEATFVEYLGDIKFPDISEEDSVNNLSGTPYFPLSQSDPDNTQFTIAYNLGIQFDIDFSTCLSLLNKITSYQIVRVKREDTDKRRLTQGNIKSFWWAAISSTPALGDFDFKIDGNTEVVHLMPSGTSASYGITTFSDIGDQESSDNNITIPPGDPNRIKSQYLGFYSPEISYNYQNVINNSTLGTGLLMTGAYELVEDILDLTTSDQSDVALATVAEDRRIKIKNSVPITFNSIENIKRWSNSMYQNMIDTSTYTEKITPLYDGYYMRNYWALGGSSNLNAPNITGSNISRGGSSVIGNTTQYTLDPITQQPVPTIADTDFFKIDGNTTLSGGIDTISSSLNDCTPIVDIIVPRAEVYGGYSTSALEVNTFIACSPVIDIANLNPIVFGGDIFMNMFTQQTSMLDFNVDFFDNAFEISRSITQVYVTESCINIDLAYGATTRTLVKYTFDGKEEAVFRQENNNTFAPTAKDKSNMYAYNPVNSKENSDVTYFIKPSNAEQSDTNDIRAYLSNVKINGEVIDSWTKFGVNNFYDIDDYGPINKILNYKDNVFFIQDRAVGVYAINRSAITTTADGVPTQLGTGLGFGKHQYQSKENGSIHQWGIKATENGIYIFDALHRKIFIASGEGNNPLSEAKGIHSLLQALPPHIFLRKENGGDNPILGKGVHIGKDSINNEVLFTFLSINRFRELQNSTSYSAGQIVLNTNSNIYYYVTTPFTSSIGAQLNAAILIQNSRLAKPSEVYTASTIVYDELAQQFSTLLSQTPKIWVDNTDILISGKLLDNKRLYTHNIGNWGVFYDEPVECYIKLVLNPQADINKVLRTLEFNSIVRDNNKVIDREATITAFRIQTQYQDTLKVPFSADRIKRRFDKWRVKIPRDQLSVSKQGRLRSTYFIVTLYYDNTDNKELIMNRLLSYFDYQVF